MSRRRLARSALVVVVLLGVLGCEPTTVQELGRPALIILIQEASGFCSATIAVDANNDVWREEGCEMSSSGLGRAMRRIADSDRARYDGLFSEVLELPEDGDCAVINPSARRFRFTRTDPDGTEVSVLQCEPGVPANAQVLVREFEAFLGAVPVDAGPADAG